MQFKATVRVYTHYILLHTILRSKDIDNFEPWASMTNQGKIQTQAQMNRQENLNMIILFTKN